jgi:hypothetical protein
VLHTSTQKQSYVLTTITQIVILQICDEHPAWTVVAVRAHE